MFKNDLTAHPVLAASIALLVFVQFRLLLEDAQNTFRARYAKLDQAKGPVGIESRVAQYNHQAHKGNQATHGDLIMHHQEEAVKKGENQGNREQQRRQIPGLDIAVSDKKVAIESGALLKLVHLLLFLGRSFHHLDAANRFIQARV